MIRDLSKYDFFNIPFNKRIITFQEEKYRYVPLKEIIVGNYSDFETSKNFTLDKQYIIGYTPLYNDELGISEYFYNSILKLNMGETIRSELYLDYNTILATIFNETDIGYLVWKLYYDRYHAETEDVYALSDVNVYDKIYLRNYSTAMYCKIKEKPLQIKLLNQIISNQEILDG